MGGRGGEREGEGGGVRKSGRERGWEKEEEREGGVVRESGRERG